MSTANEKPFVFISYAHANSDRVLPILRAMQKSDICLWYDGGIEAGSEWPEFIAEKVVSCHKFILFISEAYLNSQNCKRELNFAISRRKNILAVFLEDVYLSPGMEMQLGTYQALYMNRFPTPEDFCRSLCAEPFFNDCKGFGAVSEVSSGAALVPLVPAAAHQPQQPPQQPVYGHQPPQQPRYGHQAPPSQQPPRQTPQPQRPQNVTPVPPNSGKSRVVAPLLAFFFGFLGIHFFYLGKVGWGITYLLFSWTFIPGFVAFFQAIYYLCISAERFERCCVKHR